jgi:hypothetical protein
MRQLAFDEPADGLFVWTDLFNQFPMFADQMGGSHNYRAVRFALEPDASFSKLVQ